MRAYSPSRYGKELHGLERDAGVSIERLLDNSRFSEGRRVAWWQQTKPDDDVLTTLRQEVPGNVSDAEFGEVPKPILIVEENP